MSESKSDLALDGWGAAAIALPDDASHLLRLAELARQLGADKVGDEACDLASRVAECRFYVACVGQFKRGKSTLINALIGREVLPTGFIPITAVPTVIRFGKYARARVRTRHGSWRDIALPDLKNYVSEERNPENTKGVDGAEVFVPSRLLASGMCFVDTPGLGSVFTGNTAATQAFVPHIDAALVVVGADPPIAGEELTLVEAVGKQAQDLIVVINKADRTTDAERAAAVIFTRQILEKRLHRPMGEVFEVSAAERLQNHGPLRDWQRLIDSLQHLVNDSGRKLVRAAYERGRQRLSEHLLAIIGEDRDALKRPLEESERRITVMKRTIAEAERSMRELSFLFTAEQQRISDLLVGRHREFLNSVMPNANREFSEGLVYTAKGWGPHYRRRAMRLAQEIARRHVAPWREPEQEEGERQYRSLALRFVEMGNNFLKQLADAGLTELARIPHALDPETGFRVRSQFTFLEFIDVAQPASPLRWMSDVVLPLLGARKHITNDARGFLDRLLMVNSTRVQSDVLNRIQESRGRLEVEIHKVLHEISRTAEKALAGARKTKEEGAPAVQAELDRLQQLEREVSGLAP